MARRLKYKLIVADANSFANELNAAIDDGYSPSTFANAYTVVPSTTPTQFTVLVAKDEEYGET